MSRRTVILVLSLVLLGIVLRTVSDGTDPMPALAGVA